MDGWMRHDGYMTTAKDAGRFRVRTLTWTRVGRKRKRRQRGKKGEAERGEAGGG